MQGRQHELYTLVGLVLATPLAAGVWGAEGGLAFLAAGTAGTLLLSPDLDLAESRASRRWGPLSLLWAPYRWLHPHRGRSHSYLYGPLSRLAYLGGLGGVAAHLLGVEGEAMGRLREALGQREAWAALLGYMASQWAHSLQDGIGLRRWWR